MRKEQRVKSKEQKNNWEIRKFLKAFLTNPVILFFVFSFTFFVSPAIAAPGINKQINFQGKLTNSAGVNVSNNTYSVVFTLYDAPSGGATLWTETQNVTTVDGIFQVALGSVTSLATVNFNHDTLYLGIKVGADSEMTPRVRYTATPYAFNAEKLGGVTATQSATGFTFQGGTSSQSTVGFTTSGGVLTLAPGLSAGLTIQSNGANSLTLDTGGSATLAIGNNQASSITFGRSGGSITLPGFATNNNSVLYTGAAGALGAATTITSGLCLVSNTNTPSWGDCVTGGGDDLVQEATSLSPTTLAGTATLIGTVSVTPTTATGDVWVQAELWTNSLSNNNQTITWEIRSGSDCSGSVLDTQTSSLTSANSSDGPSGFLSYVTANPGASQQTYSVCGSSTTASGVSAGGLLTATVIDNTGPQGDKGDTGGDTLWQLLGTGVLAPTHATTDLLVGATSTASARFAVLNVNAGSGSPTASVSAGTTGGAYLTAAGELQTTARQSLTIGGSTTGNIVLDSGTGVITLSDATTATSGLTITAGQNLTINSEAFNDLKGNGLTVSSNALTINLTSSGNTGLSSSNSGLEVGSGGLTLLKGCNDGQTLSYTDAGGWACATGAGSNWDVASGTITPKLSSTLDLLIGGVSTASARFHAYGSNALTAGTTPSASISARSSFAALVVDNSNSGMIGDIIAASSSGISRFVVKQNGNVGIGTALPTSTLDVVGNMSISGISNLVGGATINGTTSQTVTTTVTSGASIVFSSNNQTNGLMIQRNGAGTTTNGITISQGVGTMTNGLNFSGTIGTDITRATGAVTIGGQNGAQFTSVSGTSSVASVAAATTYAGLVADNSGSGDIFTASSSGLTRFTIQQSGVVVIGNATNGIQFDYLNGGPTYAGLARPTKKIVLSPEFSGAILTASGSSTTNGNMTSDASTSANLNLGGATNNFMTYYEWTSSQTSLQDYTVAVKVTLPPDFSSWVPGGTAIQVAFNTELGQNGSAKLDMRIIPETQTSGSSAPAVYYQATNSAAKTWQLMSVSADDLNNTPAWNTASRAAMLYFKLYSRDNNHVQLGDIVLNYLSRF